MSETRAAAERLREVLRRLGRGLNLPHPSACANIAEQMGQTEAPIPPPDPRTLEEIKQDLRRGWQAEGAASLDRDRLRQLPLVLWHRPDNTSVQSRGTELSAQVPELWPAFLASARRSEKLLAHAIDGWLRDFNPDVFGLTQAGVDIANRLGATHDPRLVPWAVAQKKFGLFFAGSGPTRIAAALFDLTASSEAILQTACLASPLRQQGKFFQACLIGMLGLTPAELMKQTSVEAFERLRSLIEVNDVVDGRAGRKTTQHRIRFPAMERSVARGCLLAWAEGRAHANAPKLAVQRFLLTVIGDPRLRPLKWRDVEPQIASVMRRWVSEQSLEAFLSLIRDENDSEQWKHREAFWRGCFKKSPEAEVWVVLGRDLAQRAKLVADLQGNFGQMNSPSQAVLLMRIKNIVFSEWSNVGALRAWEISDPKCPQMYYAQEYTQHSLRETCLEFPDEHGATFRGSGNDGRGLYHHSPLRGLWQARAAQLLRQKAGVHLLRADYMPK